MFVLGHSCGCPNVVYCTTRDGRVRACVFCAQEFVSRVNLLTKEHICLRVCVWMREATGCASLSATALPFLFGNWRRQRSRHTAVTAG